MPSGWIGRPAGGVEASRDEGTGASVPVIEAVLSPDGRIEDVAASVLAAAEDEIVGSAAVLEGADGKEANEDDCSSKKELEGD